jgi:spore coat polysaccharide biosynthesis protein SpsF
MVIDKRPLLIITARLGSTRLPGKVLMPFWKKCSLLEFLIRRLQTRPETSRLVLATADTLENDIVAEIGKKCGIKVFEGSENNVLERMYKCIESEKIDFIGRVTADNPFTDPKLILLQLKEMKRVGADYSYCKESPKGTAVDIWTINCFEETYNNAIAPYELEHVNAWVWNHPELFKILWFKPPDEYINNNINLSVDTEDDFNAVKKMAMRFEAPFTATIAELIVFS